MHSFLKFSLLLSFVCRVETPRVVISEIPLGIDKPLACASLEICFPLSLKICHLSLEGGPFIQLIL